MRVTDVPEASRWEARTDDGVLAGIAEYVLADGEREPQ